MQATANDQFLVNSPSMTDSEVKEALFQMAQVVTTQAKAIMAHDNREVAPRVNEHVSTAASHLRDFTRMDPPKYIGSKVHMDPKISLMISIRFFLLWG